MRQIVYESVATDKIDRQGLKEILATSISNNTKCGLSGAFFTNGQRIFQVLEGDETAVDKTFGRIKTDIRHRDVKILLDRQSDRRDFPEWSMMLIDNDPESQRVQNWFWPKDKNDVAGISGGDVLEFLKLSSVVAHIEA